MNLHDQSNPLMALGFTEIETQVYLSLLREAPVTGYRLAQGLGKPAANIYKALESLERKGAVIVEEGTHRLARPVPPANFLRQMDRSYRRLRRKAEKRLTETYRSARDDRVYRIRSTGQVQEHAVRMVGEAREIVLIDAFPESIELLRPTIRDAIARDVLVGVKTYAPTDIAGAVVVMGAHAETTRERWPGCWLNVVADGAQYMIALLSKDMREVVQAVWTECPYLAWVHQSAFSAEMILTALDTQLESGASLAELKATRQRLSRLTAHLAPGYRSIMGEFQEDPTEGSR